MFKHGSLILTTGTTEITQESTAHHHHLCSCILQHDKQLCIHVCIIWAGPQPKTLPNSDCKGPEWLCFFAVLSWLFRRETKKNWQVASPWSVSIPLQALIRFSDYCICAVWSGYLLFKFAQSHSQYNILTLDKLWNTVFLFVCCFFSRVFNSVETSGFICSKHR